VSLFDDGLRTIAERTGWRSVGVVPWFELAGKLPAEDSVDIERKASTSQSDRRIKIAVPLLPRIANHDDLDPLSMEPDVTLNFVRPGEPLPGDADLVILPGSKSTIADLGFFAAQGWDIDLRAHLRRGGHVLGLCGGFQMLGNWVRDRDGLEGPPGDREGLALLDLETVLTTEKRLEHVTGRHKASGAPVAGYEMHMGRTTGGDLARPFLEIDGRAEGAVSSDGRVSGTYVHGIFAQDKFRHAFLNQLRSRTDHGLAYEQSVEQTLDALADHLEAALDIESISAIAKSRQRTTKAVSATMTN